MNYVKLNEKELIDRAAQGETKAFDALVTRIHEKVYLSLLAKNGNPDLSEDITQQAFVKAWKSIAKFRKQSSFYTWVYRIAHNLLIDFYRKTKRRKEFSYDLGMESASFESKLPHAEPAAFENIANRELMAQINLALDKLTDQHKETLILYEIEDLTYKEIAERMDCSLGTVMSRLFYARRQTRSHLSRILELDKV